MRKRLTNNRAYKTLFLPSKQIAIIGVKGMPPEFPGTSGVEFYVERRLPFLTALHKETVCYIRSWPNRTPPKKHHEAKLITLPSIHTVYLDAISHSFLATVHAGISSVDTVWYQASGPALFAPLARLFGKRVLVTIHTKEWERNKWGMVSKLMLRLGEFLGTRFANAVITVSDDLSRYITKTYGIPAVTDPLRSPTVTPISPAFLHRKYRLASRSYLLYMGRFVPEKRIEWLIEGFKKLSRSPIQHLVIAGGNYKQSTYEKKLRNLAKHTPGILFTGWVFGKEKEALLSHCRLFVLPSRVEGNPVVLQELHPGTIALVSERVAKMRPLVTTHVFPEDNKEAFIQALVKLTTEIAQK
jgi:glycosyltransferase involved in cell wall biosynthesis